MTLENLELSQNPNIVKIDFPRDTKGRVRWVVLKNDPEQLETIVRHLAGEFYQSHDTFTARELEKYKNRELITAMRFYPGGFRQLRLDAELPKLIRKRRSLWTAETVKEEASDFYLRIGKLTYNALKETSRYNL